MAKRVKSLPPDGIYRTTKPLPGKERGVPGGMLVYFQRTSGNAEVPIVLMPERNTHNKWLFRRSGFLVKDRAWIATLTPLLSEGYYFTTEAIGLSSSVEVPAYGLVQLGYNRNGHAIVFPPRYVDNRIEFGEKGKRFEDLSVLQKLIPAGFERPLDATHFIEP